MSEKIILTVPLLKMWIRDLGKFSTRPESAMYRPTVEEVSKAMENHGWDDNKLIQALNELTDGAFSRSPKVFLRDDFDQLLHDIIMTAIQPVPGLPASEDRVSAFWPIKLKMLKLEVQRTPAERSQCIEQEYFPIGPNDPAKAYDFASRLLEKHAAETPDGQQAASHAEKTLQRIMKEREGGKSA